MKSSLGIIAFLVCYNLCQAQEESANELYTIYLVRHAEKVVAPQDPDPPLTPCGNQRAASLADFFGNIELEAVYSTNYIRTRNTAKPTAVDQNLEIINYDPRDLTGIAKRLKSTRQDALVVGHSNTTAVLAGLLIGEELGAFDESIYNRIYQVVLNKKTGRLHIFNSTFDCEL